MTIVSDKVCALWTGHVEQAVLMLDVETLCGAKAMHYLLSAEGLLAQTDEGDEFLAIVEACTRQVHVWYFG
jgi:hypothetical protein